MALTRSTMVPLGTPAPDFDLPSATGGQVTLVSHARAPALLVVFMCNHCPYVKHVADELARLYRDYQPLGLAMVGINSNDADAYPEDAPDEMREEAEQRGYDFAYLYDANQAVARAYGAVCTPDFFLFDWARELVYRGQLDDSRPGNGVPVTGKDLRAAIDAVLNGRKPEGKQAPSMGCNIKWRS